MLNVTLSSADTFTILEGYTGTTTISAGTEVYLADYQNGNSHEQRLNRYRSG